VKCPHCEKTFDKLAMLVDDSGMVRETYYACPHCRSKVDINVKGSMPKFHTRKGSNSSQSERTCPYYFGYLSLFGKGGVVPETCLTCAKITRCMAEMKQEK
jgi:DNA-directed RNA polymerase subunit RPC12/RpoP